MPVCESAQLGSIDVAPFAPHAVHRLERRSTSLGWAMSASPLIVLQNYFQHPGA